MFRTLKKMWRRGVSKRLRFQLRFLSADPLIQHGGLRNSKCCREAPFFLLHPHVTGVPETYHPNRKRITWVDRLYSLKNSSKDIGYIPINVHRVIFPPSLHPQLYRPALPLNPDRETHSETGSAQGERQRAELNFYRAHLSFSGALRTLFHAAAMQTLQSPSLRLSPLESLSLPKRGTARRVRSGAFVRRVVSASASAPKRETDPKKRVVLTGMGLVSVFGNDVDVYYDRLLAGESGIGLIDRFDASKFPTRFGGQIRGFTSDGYIDGKNDRRLDDCLRYCLVSGKKALEDAGLGAGNIDKVPKTYLSAVGAECGGLSIDSSGNLIDKERAGVLVGTGMGGVSVFSDGVQALTEKGYRKITPFFIPYAITNMGSALLAIELGFMGPNYSISTACATSNYCFYAAANHIRRGDADLMIAGGTEAAIIPIGLGGFVACRALSQRNDDPQTASRPWDKNRDGFVMGEGSGVLVMESLEHAMKRGAPIIAEYLGGSVNCDAYHLTDPRADGLGVSSCIERGLEDAGVSPEEGGMEGGILPSLFDIEMETAFGQAFDDIVMAYLDGSDQYMLESDIKAYLDWRLTFANS
ncbi:3-oxoacyl-[acyl-carrier-protein] synthase I, chloroplastic [Asimina triloba]